MVRTKIMIFCLMFLSLCFLWAILIPISLAQPEEALEVKEIKGEIIGVNLATSEILVKPFQDEGEQAHDNVVFVRDGSTTIEQESGPLSIEELSTGDKVFIEYSTDSAGKNLAINIWVENRAISESL